MPSWVARRVPRASALALGVGLGLGASVGAGIGFGIAAGGCAPRPRMCTAMTDCAARTACVAGRCQSESPTAKPLVEGARRWVVRPSEVAYVHRDAIAASVPPLFALGRDSARLFLRFSVALPITSKVVEAYIVLRRASAVDDDPEPLVLHATRIVDPWEARSTSWTLQPRLAPMSLPAAVVEPTGPSLIRVDVREIVSHWPRRDPRDQGVALIAENETRTGTTFAFRAVDSGGAEGQRLSSGTDVEPYLELYVR